MLHHRARRLCRRDIPPQLQACLSLSLLLLSSTVSAEELSGLPSPLRVEDVLVYARAHRQEIVAARARARAAAARPAIVSALEDPMVMASVDHLPFALHGVDASLMVEQRFPFSRILGNRRRAAQADARRVDLDRGRVELDVELDAARAFYMLWERRQLSVLIEEQRGLARDLVTSATARYRTGIGAQPDVLRAEIEVARLEGTRRALQREVEGAEAMLNTALGRDADAPMPPLEATPTTSEPAEWSVTRELTLRLRPELSAGRADIERAQAEVSVMRSMYAPMGFIRTGPAYTMADRWGWMLMLGVSVPLQLGRLRAGVREAQAMLEMAQADLAAMRRMAQGEAAGARAEVRAAIARLLALRDDVVPRARQAIEPSVAAYATGTLPLVSVIDAAQALWAVQAERITAEAALGLAWASLDRAQGRLAKDGAR